MLKKGGNKRFSEFLNEYKVPDNATMDFKYMIRASDFYRKLLKAEVYQGEYTQKVPFKPDIISGLEMIDYGVNAEPKHFENSNPIMSSQPQTTKNSNSNTFFGKVNSYWSVAKEKAYETANTVGNKIKEMEIKDKLKVTGEKAYDLIKISGEVVVEKGKEAYVIIIYNLYEIEFGNSTKNCA
jgi:hypothetical protein